MPIKGYIAKREVLPDTIYTDQVVTKLINNIMLDGKKGVAQRICYDAFDIIREKRAKSRSKFSRKRSIILCLSWKSRPGV